MPEAIRVMSRRQVHVPGVERLRRNREPLQRLARVIAPTTREGAGGGETGWRLLVLTLAENELRFVGRRRTIRIPHARRAHRFEPSKFALTPVIYRIRIGILRDVFARRPPDQLQVI